MKGLGALLGALSIPFALLNMFGGIIAGIWLAVLGDWSVIFLGIGIIFVGAIAVSLLLMPGMILAGIGAMALDRGNKAVGWFLILLASPWTMLVIIVWEVGAFWVFGKRVNAHNGIPIWLWSYGAATGVWSYLASKEQRSGDSNGESAAVLAFAAQVSYIVFSVCLIGLGWPLLTSIVAMAVPLVLPLAFALMTITVSRPQFG